MGKQIVSASPGGARVEWEDFKGKLLIIEPLELEKDIKTTHGVSDAVRANVFVVLSKDGSKAEEFEDTLVFPKVLQSQTRRKIGEYVVGRLTQGEKQPGKNPPWTLAEATPGDLAAATAFLTSKQVSSASSTEEGGEESFEDDGDAF